MSIFVQARHSHRLIYNQLGIRRMRLVNAAQVREVKEGVVRVVGDVTVDELVFLREVEAHFTCAKAPQEHGEVAYNQSIQFNGLHNQEADWSWLFEERYALWVAVVETHNSEVYILGGPREQGLRLQGNGGTSTPHLSYNLEALQLYTPIKLKGGITYLTAITDAE